MRHHDVECDRCHGVQALVPKDHSWGFEDAYKLPKRWERFNGKDYCPKCWIVVERAVTEAANNA